MQWFRCSSVRVHFVVLSYGVVKQQHQCRTVALRQQLLFFVRIQGSEVIISAAAGLVAQESGLELATSLPLEAVARLDSLE